MLKCFYCDSDKITLTYSQQVLANTLEHYCHSVKQQDSDLPSHCLTCGRIGKHQDLKAYEE